jgi:alkylation response protein AidB-like acyl-CoA dehydrogenase
MEKKVRQRIESTPSPPPDISPSYPMSDLDTLLDDVRTFVDERILPLEAPLRHEGLGAVQTDLDKQRAAVKERGWWTPQLPKDEGGMGLSLKAFGRLGAVLGRSPLGHLAFGCQAPDAGNMEILARHATARQRERFLVPLAAGDVRSCFAMTEPEHAGSNPKQLGTTARRDGDHYVLDGRKWFTTGADGAAFAIVMAVTNPEADNPYARASQLIVPTDTDGFEHVRKLPVMGEAGEGGLSHSEVRFDDCRVPVEHRLGGEGEGFRIAQERLGPDRIHHCMRWIGIAERAYEMMCERAATREIAPGEALGTKQTVQNWIAESRAEIRAARLMTLQAARRIDREGAKAAREDISVIKFYVAGILQDVLDRALQTHGGLGMTDDTMLAFWYRHERGARIYDGPDEVHKARVARYALQPYGLEL